MHQSFKHFLTFCEIVDPGANVAVYGAHEFGSLGMAQAQRQEGVGIRSADCPEDNLIWDQSEGNTMRYLGDYLTYWLLFNYAVIGLAYAWDGDWNRVQYWVGAILIVYATVRMH